MTPKGIESSLPALVARAQPNVPLHSLIV